MKIMICPLCGCGEIIETEEDFICSNCEEIFFLDRDNEWQVMDFEKWKEQRRMHNGKDSF